VDENQLTDQEVNEGFAQLNALRYPHNPLEGFANGCLLDLRVRIAIDLLKASPMYAKTGKETPFSIAVHALHVAQELMAEAERRGWVAPLPVEGELSPALKAQAARVAAFGVEQQLEAGRLAQQARGAVIPVNPTGQLPGGRH